MIDLKEAYTPRPISFLELWEYEGWKMKVYGISSTGDYPRKKLVERAKETAMDILPVPSVTNTHYGAGFIGVHEGDGASFIFIDWWTNENELMHHVYVGPHEEPGNFEYVTPKGLIACCWDLKVLSFERDSWVDQILNNPTGAPDIEGYLNCRLNELV
ncbi:isochorismatase [Virgibacillus halodenitrificans]|uniref:isochorismatase n=1 Tax=Virgibacillus halodenitrificans TaxID=1482 RepID=UPI0024BF6B7E|nr:isochorismatase [Virgibacillus halodenitrificans]WHX24583.1 isochorismatase [Virgibacillus halodenitrificans]